MYVRFVVGSDADNAYWLTGVITEARLLRDDGKLYTYETKLLEESYGWFDLHLPCPPFGSKLRSGEWTRNAVSWFLDDARECIRRVWDIVYILRENGVPVRLVATERPGRIVYRDEYQVVADTPYWA